MGGTTFVSSSLAKYLISKGYEVDILTRGQKPASYTGYREHLRCHRQSKADMQHVLKGREYEVIFDISAYTKSDVEVLLSSVETKKLDKYVLCSSGSVYRPSDNPVSEVADRGENLNWGQYGLDKKEAEDYLFDLNRKNGFPVIIFRPTYIYGENNNLYRETYFFDRIKYNQIIPVPSGNDTRTQFIHIEDLIKVFESSISNKNIGSAYNVTNPEVVSWNKLVNSCAAAIGKKAFIKEIDSSKNIKARSYFPFRDVTYLLDISNLVRDGFYVPNINLKEGLAKAYKGYANELPRINDLGMNMIEHVLK